MARLALYPKRNLDPRVGRSTNSFSEKRTMMHTSETWNHLIEVSENRGKHRAQKRETK